MEYQFSDPIVIGGQNHPDSLSLHLLNKEARIALDDDGCGFVTISLADLNHLLSLDESAVPPSENAASILSWSASPAPDEVLLQFDENRLKLSEGGKYRSLTLNEAQVTAIRDYLDVTLERISPSPVRFPDPAAAI